MRLVEAQADVACVGDYTTTVVDIVCSKRAATLAVLESTAVWFLVSLDRCRG